MERLLAAREAGLDALTVACELAWECGTVTAPLIMNARLIALNRPAALQLPDGIELHIEPIADCGRYDPLRGRNPISANYFDSTTFRVDRSAF